MEPRLLAKIGLRLLAVYLMVRGILFLPDLYLLSGSQTSFHAAGLSAYFWYAITILTPVIAGIALWAVSPVVATWMVRINGEPIQAPSVSREDISGIIISLVGVIIAVIAVPPIVYGLINTFVFPKINGLGMEVNISELPYVIASVLQLILGLWLFLGIKFWVRLLRRAREFGLE